MNPVELRRTLVLANAFKEGDLPVGGTRDDRVRQTRALPWPPPRLRYSQDCPDR